MSTGEVNKESTVPYSARRVGTFKFLYVVSRSVPVPHG
jgi:hypothetical protein